MKTTRTAGGIAGVTLIAGLTLFAATPASAADIRVDLPTPIPTEQNPYAAEWFAGTVAGGNGVATETPWGLEIEGNLAGYQLLNGTPTSTPTSTTLESLAHSLYVTWNWNHDAPVLQLSVYGEPSAAPADRQFTTLSPSDPEDLSAPWVTSEAIPGYAAGAEAALDSLVLALEADEPAKVLGFGVFVNAGEAAVIQSISFDGDNYLFYDATTATAGAPQYTVAQATSTGVSFTASGFRPGESVVIWADSEYGSGQVGTVVADGDGNVAYSEVFASSPAPQLGVITYYFTGEETLIGAAAQIEIIANPLAATGAEPNPWLIATAALLALGGTGAVIYARRNAVKA